MTSISKDWILELRLVEIHWLAVPRILYPNDSLPPSFAISNRRCPTFLIRCPMIEPRAIFTFESPLKLFTLRPSQLGPMPSSENSVSHIRKRQRCAEIEPTTTPQSPPPSKRRKLERPPQHKTPSSFWDNLSRQWLTPRALREFDRRTEQLAAPLPPDRSGLGKDHSKRLKRFARHGGPSLGDLRAVS